MLSELVGAVFINVIIYVSFRTVQNNMGCVKIQLVEKIFENVRIALNKTYKLCNLTLNSV